MVVLPTTVDQTSGVLIQLCFYVKEVEGQGTKVENEKVIRYWGPGVG